MHVDALGWLVDCWAIDTAGSSTGNRGLDLHIALGCNSKVLLTKFLSQVS
jgi:hypothetical protein